MAYNPQQRKAWYQKNKDKIKKYERERYARLHGKKIIVSEGYSYHEKWMDWEPKPKFKPKGI